METEFKLQDIKFHEKNGKVKAVFLERYYFNIPKKELMGIGRYKVEDSALIFLSGKNHEKKFQNLLANGFENLKNSINGRKTIYIHQNLGIPLIGSSYFGLVDRNSNLIEIRPNTGCNLNCIYCSVNEGLETHKNVDYVVEKDYLVQELKRLIEEKDDDDIEIHINPQGEPTLYSPLPELVKDIAKIKEVKRISMDTNGTLLNEKKVDELIEAGLTQFNISIDSLNKETASKIAGSNYSTEHIKKICKYIASKTNLLIAPLWLQGMNDDDIEDLIRFGKEVGAIKIGIQNFLNYKGGKNPVKAITMDEFYEKLSALEEKYDYKLKYGAEDFKVHPTKKLKAPFKKDDVVKARIVFSGRMKDEMIAVSDSRVIEIKEFNQNKTLIKAKLVRSKHNIFHGIAVN